MGHALLRAEKQARLESGVEREGSGSGADIVNERGMNSFYRAISEGFRCRFLVCFWAESRDEKAQVMIITMAMVRININSKVKDGKS